MGMYNAFLLSSFSKLKSEVINQCCSFQASIESLQAMISEIASLFSSLDYRVQSQSQRSQVYAPSLSVIYTSF